jgi:hypothetical protein
MNENQFKTAPAADTNLDPIEVRLQGKLRGRIRDFQILFHDCGIVLRGYARTYYEKQMAQHAVIMETNLPILTNEIEVD